MDKLLHVVSLMNDINMTDTYTETYVIVEGNNLSGWFDGLVAEILEKLDPHNYKSHTKYHRALHFYYDKNKVWVDRYYISSPYLFQIVKILGHWALLNNRIVELREVEIPICQEITGIKNGVFQYSKITDPQVILERIREREERKNSYLPEEKVRQIILEEIERECRKENCKFDAPGHAKWAEERVVKITAPVI